MTFTMDDIKYYDYKMSGCIYRCSRDFTHCFTLNCYVRLKMDYTFAIWSSFYCAHISRLEFYQMSFKLLSLTSDGFYSLVNLLHDEPSFIVNIILLYFYLRAI